MYITNDIFNDLNRPDLPHMSRIAPHRKIMGHKMRIINPIELQLIMIVERVLSFDVLRCKLIWTSI